MTSTTRLKLLHFIENSASSAYLNSIAEHFDRDRFDVSVGSLGAAGALQEDMAARGVPAFALGCTSRTSYPRAVARLARRIREERFDIVQTHLFEASFVGLVASRLARVPLAIVNDHHSAEVLLHGRRAVIWVDRLITKHLAHRVLAPSAYMRDILVREEGVTAEHIAVIPYGLDLDRLRPAAGARERVRAELGVSGIVFGAVGRLSWVKNYPLLMSAFSELARQRRDVTLVIAGDGPDRSRLEAEANDLALNGRVRFVGHRRDVVDFLSAIDVLVHASRVECSVQVVPEAYAVGTPVVSTRVGGATEIIESGVNGYLVPPNDAAALRSALEQMLERRGEWCAMGEAGKRIVERNVANRIQPLYEAQYIDWLSERRAMHREREVRAQ